MTDGRGRNADIAGFIAATSEEHHDDVHVQMTDEFVTSADSSWTYFQRLITATSQDRYK